MALSEEDKEWIVEQLRKTETTLLTEFRKRIRKLAKKMGLRW